MYEIIMLMLGKVLHIVVIFSKMILEHFWSYAYITGPISITGNPSLLLASIIILVFVGRYMQVTSKPRIMKDNASLSKRKKTQSNWTKSCCETP